MLGPVTTKPEQLRALGYISRGGTFDVAGMLFANRCTWAHTVDAAMALLPNKPLDLLSEEERCAIDGQGDPSALERSKPVLRREHAS